MRKVPNGWAERIRSTEPAKKPTKKKPTKKTGKQGK
jgi:hypothetical protein